MSTATYWLRLTLRRRWVSLIALTLVVALASGVVLAAFAGARRGASSWERLKSATNGSSALVGPVTTSDVQRLVALPYVKGVLPVKWENLPITDPANTPRDSVFMTGLPAGANYERPVVVDGRMYSNLAANEVVVNEGFVSQLHRGIGDSVTALVPRRISAAGGGGILGDVSNARASGDAVALRIVGVVRSPTLSLVSSIGTPALMASPAFFTKYKERWAAVNRALGAPNRQGGLVTLRHGAADLPALEAAAKTLPRQPGAEQATVQNITSEGQAVASLVRVESLALFGLALAATLAALVVVGLIVVRRARVTTADAKPLGGIGLGRVALALAGAGPVLVATTIGVVIGAFVATLTSSLTPIGSSRQLEPQPGILLDPLVLGGGAVVIAILLAAFAWAAAWSDAASGGPARGRARLRSATRSMAGPKTLPLGLAVGQATSLSPRGRVGPTWLAPLIGVVGLVSAAFLAAGVTDMLDQPLRSAPGPSVLADVGYQNRFFVPPSTVNKLLTQKDPGKLNQQITAIYPSPGSSVRIGGHDVPFSVFDTSRTTVRRPLVEGRWPEAADEIALGPRTARELGVGVGELLTVDRPGAKGKGREFRVVGLGLNDANGTDSYDVGAGVTAAGYEQIFGRSFDYYEILVVLKPGTDPVTWAKQWGGEFQLSDALTPLLPPRQVSNFRAINHLPWYFGIFLALLGIVGLGFGISASQRANRRTHAILRSTGLAPGQTRWAVMLESLGVALIALAIGIPVGILVGREVWRRIAFAVPVEYVVPQVPGLFAGVTVGLLGLAVVLAAVPAWRAGRLPVAALLRGE